MAIKDQCLNCTLFNQVQGICSNTGTTPSYDNHSCSSYARIGGSINLNKGHNIDLSKPESRTSSGVQPPVPVSPQPSSCPSTPTGSSTQQGTTSNKLFAHPFSFDGRIRRLEFNLSYLIYMVWYIIYMALL